MEPDEKNLKSMISWYFKNRGADADVRACPREEFLHDYLQDRLERQVRQDVERHLAHCRGCLMTLQALAEILEDDRAPAREIVPARVLERALSLVPGKDEPGLAGLFKGVQQRAASVMEELAELISFKSPEYVYVRGSRTVISESLVALEKEFKDIRLELEIEKTGDQTTDIKVNAFQPQTGRPLSGVRINLACGSSEIASFVTSRGEVLFEGVEFGEYRLEAWEAQKRLGKVLINIEE